MVFRIGLLAAWILTLTTAPQWCRADSSSPEPADVVLYGGKIITVDAEFRIAEAMAVRGERIVEVGRASCRERV